MHQLDVDAIPRTLPLAGRAGKSRRGAGIVLYRGLHWRLALDGTMLVRDAHGPERAVDLNEAPLPVKRSFGLAVVDDLGHAEPAWRAGPPDRV